MASWAIEAARRVNWHLIVDRCGTKRISKEKAKEYRPKKENDALHQGDKRNAEEDIHILFDPLSMSMIYYRSHG